MFYVAKEKRKKVKNSKPKYKTSKNPLKLL